MAIDYARMQRVHPKQKAALTRAMKTGDLAKVTAVCKAAVTEWNAIGAWPDDWSRWQRALDDVTMRTRLRDGTAHLPTAKRLEDL